MTSLQMHRRRPIFGPRACGNSLTPGSVDSADACIIRMLRRGRIFGPPLCAHDSRAGCGGSGFSSLLQNVTRLRRFLLLAPAVPATKQESRFPQLPFWFLLLPAPQFSRVQRRTAVAFYPQPYQMTQSGPEDSKPGCRDLVFIAMVSAIWSEIVGTSLIW